MRKLHNIICDNPGCKKIIETPVYEFEGKKRTLHYCSEQCYQRHYLHDGKYKE